MPDFFSNVTGMMDKSNQQLTALFDKLFSFTGKNAVFSEPIQAGDYTVITASEISGGGMYFSGMGGGIGEGKKNEEQPATPPVEPDNQEAQPSGGGAGASGGGWSGARPVATIILGPNGVQVQPVVDPTKIALAFFTTVGAIFMMRRRMFRQYQKMLKTMK